MFVLDCIKNHTSGMTISVEIEPPKIGKTREKLFRALDEISKLGINFINITYHAAQIVGDVDVHNIKFPLYQRLKPGTAGISGAIIERYREQKILPVPHIICTGFTKYSTEDFLHELACLGVKNVLAIRGDGVKDQQGQSLPFQAEPGGHSQSCQLIQQIMDLREGKYIGAEKGDPLYFSIGAGCYPEGHPHSPSIGDDIKSLKLKSDLGADWFVSQMGYDWQAYAKYRDKAQQAGVRAPIIPGIKPFSIYNHLKVLPRIFGCRLPKELVRKVEAHKDDPESIRKIGVEWCIKQCLKYKELGVPGLHFYMAREAPVMEAIKAVRCASKVKPRRLRSLYTTC